MSKYIDLLEKANVTPNFYISEEYFRKAQLQELSYGNPPLIGIVKDGWWVFPLITNSSNPKLSLYIPEGLFVWSDFPEWNPQNRKSEPLDLEYIYDPKTFLIMEGGEWAVFRKNCRKWPKRFGGEGFLTYDLIENYRGNETPTDPLISWLESKNDQRIEDDEVMISYVKGGQNRKALWDRRGHIYGLNIWDVNYRFINFRYCICRQEEFLSEYMRWLFYTDPDIHKIGKMVNDGGNLGNDQLNRFKRKLNPVRVREVRSWFMEGK